jgi:FHA domain-containing protein
VGGIPEDFDPFAMPSRTPRNTDDPLRDLARSSIDLQALDGSAKGNSMLDFELAPKSDSREPLHGDTPSLIEAQQVVDPLRLFGGPDDALLHGAPVEPPGRGLPMPDNVPEIGAHFVPPRGIAEAVAPPPTAKASASAPETPAQEARATPAPVAPRAPVTSSLEREAAPGAPAPAAAHVTAQAMTGTPDDPLLTAFLKGARMAGLSAPIQLTPALMETIGMLVYQATAGAMELIATRRITKREIRADVTMVVTQGNNPLKFLPTPEAAMMQMLGPKMPGFMATREAMEDAFDDLRAHEVGVIAGVRAALAEVLRRFDPATLEERLGKGGLLDSLVPAARRAKLWDLFQVQFEQLCREANDDFQSLFGEAFIKAYEDQIEQDRIRRNRK